jgi:hypothetical protein
MKQGTQLAMTHRIVFFMPRFNCYGNVFILFRLLPLEVQ